MFSPSAWTRGAVNLRYEETNEEHKYGLSIVYGTVLVSTKRNKIQVLKPANEKLDLPRVVQSGLDSLSGRPMGTRLPGQVVLWFLLAPPFHRPSRTVFFIFPPSVHFAERLVLTHSHQSLSSSSNSIQSTSHALTSSKTFKLQINIIKQVF
jgi:hypothetical protein